MNGKIENFKMYDYALDATSVREVYDMSQGFHSPPKKHVDSKEVEPLQIEGENEG